jgi:hypothetical protein
MPSWNRSRSEKPNEKDLRRRTIFDYGQHESSPPAPMQGFDGQSEIISSSPRRNRRLRDSVVSLSAVNEPTSSFPHSSPLLEISEAPHKPLKNNRFSLLKFRHASDSHLSKTAKEHAEQAPPIPTCKFYQLQL